MYLVGLYIYLIDNFTQEIISCVLPKDIYTIKLTFNGLKGQCCPLKSITFSSEWENNVLQWLFILSSASTIAERWQLEGRTLKFKTRAQTNHIWQSDTYTLQEYNKFHTKLSEV